MEDRYLFKAKRVSNGEWIVGGLVRYGFTGKEKYYKHRLEYDTEYEVVGNVFDNPELLESEG